MRTAELATRELNAPCLTAMLEDRYLDSFLASAGTDAPKVEAQDMQAIRSPVDFVGINIYGPAAYVRAARNDPSPTLRHDPHP
jgi:beta-glucosidase